MYLVYNFPSIKFLYEYHWPGVKFTLTLAK